MKYYVGWVLVLILVLAGCNENEAGTPGEPAAQVEAEAPKKDSVFGGYLSAVEKAKSAQSVANSRQQEMDGMVGAETSSDVRHTLGMNDLRASMDEVGASSDGSLFGDMKASMNKAKGTASMLNQRQSQMDSMWGVQSQSARVSATDSGSAGSVPSGSAEAAGDVTAAPVSIMDQAESLQTTPNDRNIELESIWGVNSQSSQR